MAGNDRTLTSANAIITMTVDGIFSTPQQMQGFATDNIFDIGTQDQAQTQMGVDGRLSGGFVYEPVDMTLSFMADSESIDFFETWAQSQRQNQTTYVANGNVTLLAVHKSYSLVRGFFVNYQPMSPAGKILGARRPLLRWQGVVASPV